MKNIGPALAGSAGPVPPPLYCCTYYYKAPGANCLKPQSDVILIKCLGNYRNHVLYKLYTLTNNNSSLISSLPIL